MYHNFFIYLSVGGHLDCFHVLVIANSAAVNNGIYVSFQFWHKLPTLNSTYIGLRLSPWADSSPCCWEGTGDRRDSLACTKCASIYTYTSHADLATVHHDR